MRERELDHLDLFPQQLAALSRWDNEGGAGTDGPQAGSCPDGGASNVPLPYKRTAVFHAHTLPAGLRNKHRTKPGVWGVIRVLEGRVRYHVLDPASVVILDADHPGLVLPDVPHAVEPFCPMRMYVEFYKQVPELKLHAAASKAPKVATSTKVC